MAKFDPLDPFRFPSTSASDASDSPLTPGPPTTATPTPDPTLTPTPDPSPTPSVPAPPPPPPPTPNIITKHAAILPVFNKYFPPRPRKRAGSVEAPLSERPTKRKNTTAPPDPFHEKVKEGASGAPSANGSPEPSCNNGSPEPAFNNGSPEPAFNNGSPEPTCNNGSPEPTSNNGSPEPPNTVPAPPAQSTAADLAAVVKNEFFEVLNSLGFNLSASAAAATPPADNVAPPSPAAVEHFPGITWPHIVQMTGGTKKGSKLTIAGPPLPESDFAKPEDEYTEESDYPTEVSGRYLGSEGKQYPTLAAQRCAARLQIGKPMSGQLIALLNSEFKAHMIVEGFNTKTGPGNQAKWDKMLAKMVKHTQTLPLSIKEQLKSPSATLEVWNQRRRYYWNALDSMAIHAAKNLRTSQEDAKKILESLNEYPPYVSRPDT